ncbi:organic solute transporter Ostalpha-domain-containing protein [Boeremia exigua]|uniref:organic solute transporter Ostalpha-domain-containing protein n=1 Tax=Boeremia exigua TaxID=749465 RepID=UPI001E8D429F|nr:organic solute transporter Ostalpha-domain-containing protein [Boeremia exigua]KAH6629452.1 organic solute transporter Ostalpha-domain-containing protein [Boeremia exigua]
MATAAGVDRGTGQRLGHAVIIVAGVCALVSSLVSFIAVWLQTKNYRKPLLQRYVVRILLMVPIYAAASWGSLMSVQAASFIDPLRDIYEAFTIYTFLQLLINFIGGERALIILMTGRAPVSHPWPMNLVLPKLDISDPHTFLAVKRGILQYTWVKPLLALAGVIMKATGVYKEGYIDVSSGYFWESFIYNVSITVCLYALAMFWVCMTDDLKPFRPMPKFLCIKGIIFASYWQGLFLSILVYLGAIPNDVPGYSVDNLATAIQDALICFEMPLFALAHWYAFSWHDYADNTISAARLPVKYALRDAFGPLDLIQDTKDTFAGKKYDYRHFDARDNVLAHEESSSRAARMKEGMRYERNGKGKYWIPKPGQASEHEPLLNKVSHGRARAMSPGPRRALESSNYGTREEFDEPTLEPEDERLFDNARALEYGDWNYPVIEAHRARREDRFTTEPPIITASTNRNFLQPTADNKRRRKSQIKKIQDDKGKHDKGKQRSDSSSNGHSRVPVVGNLLRQKSSSASSTKSDKSQLVDLVVEDHDAEEVDRIRARKEGGPAWNEVENKHFVHTYPQDGQAEEVREGFEPDVPEAHNPERVHNLDYPFRVGSDEEDGDKDFKPPVNEQAERWETRDYSNTDDASDAANRPHQDRPSPNYGSFREERNVWGQD